MKFKFRPNRVVMTYLKDKHSKDTKRITLQSYLDNLDFFKAKSLRYQETGNKEDKLSLPLIIPSGYFKGGHDQDSLRHLSGFSSFDLDEIEGNVQDYKAALSEVPYVAFVMESVSGKGLWGLVRFKKASNYLFHYEALVKDMEKRGLTLDRTGMNINRLRFVSWDENPYIADEVEVFDKVDFSTSVRTEDGIKVDYRPRHNKAFSRLDNGWIKRFNKTADIDEILERNDWEFVREDAKGRRHYLRPGGGSHDASGHVFEGRAFWCHTFNSALQPQSINLPFDLLCYLEFEGDAKKALTHIRKFAFA